MRTIAVLLCACAVAMASATSECGREGEDKCAADKDSAALLQSTVLLHGAPSEVAQVEATSSSLSVSPAEQAASPSYTYAEGPRVANGAYAGHCNTWYGTLDDAKEKCSADAECKVLHDYGCDGANWRYCTTSLQTIQDAGADTSACTMTRQDHYVFVHDGHCAGGWIGGNTQQGSIPECASQCRGNSNCAYFAYNSVSTSGSNCAMYNAAGGCPDDNKYADYNSFRMSNQADGTPINKAVRTGCWEKKSDSNGQYVTIPNGKKGCSSSDSIKFGISCKVAGTTTVSARIIAPTGNDDSFRIQVDSDTRIDWHTGRGTSWFWATKPISTKKGAKLLNILNREDGIKVSEIKVGGACRLEGDTACDHRWSDGSPAASRCIADSKCQWTNNQCESRVSCSARTVSTCDPNNGKGATTRDRAMSGEDPCMWMGDKCVVGCRTYTDKHNCVKNTNCRWRWAGYNMDNGWYCMGSYQEVYVGGDNACHWYVNGKCTRRERYGGRNVMRPEYMVKERLKDDNSKWSSCGQKDNCFYGKGTQSVYVKLTGGASSTGSYLKAAISVVLKCTNKESIWIQVQDWQNTFGAKSTKTGYNTNAKLELFYNDKDVTNSMSNRAHWGWKEYTLTSHPDDKVPILRLEVSRRNAGSSASFEANVIVNRARVSVDSCMTNKANRAQCLADMEKSHPDTTLRSSHSEQAACIKKKGNDAVCKAWRACLNQEAMDMITTVDDAFGYASLLQQSRSVDGQPQTEPRCAGASNEYKQLNDCKCGHHGTCQDPYSIDIESFDCACLDDVKKMNKADLKKHLCGRTDVCCDWKLSEGCTSRTPWRGGTLALAETAATEHIENNMSTRSHTEEVSLDESLSGKRGEPPSC